MKDDKEKIIKAFAIPVLIVIICVIIEAFEAITGFSISSFGILPRKAEGLYGLFFAPLLHSGFMHLFANSVPVLILGFALFYFYPQTSRKAFLIIYFATNLLVWIFARQSYHIGASGIVYGLASFLFFSGIFKKDTRAVTLAVLVIFFYGGMIWGILPLEKGVSWESHLSGGITGFISSIIFRKKDKYKKYDWEDEESEIPARELKIRYDKGN